MVHRSTIWGHNGGTRYHHSIFYYIPKQKIGVVVFTNSEQAPFVTETMAEKTLITYLENKGIYLDKLSFCYDYVSANCEKYLGKYATGLGVLDIRKNNRGELTTKVKGLSVKMKACKDGFWHLYPNNLLSHLPPIKKAVKKLRLKFADYAGEKILIIEQSDEYDKEQEIFGCRCVETDIPKNFRQACGSYELVNKNMGELKGSSVLKIHRDMLFIRMKIQIKDFKMKDNDVCLKVIDDNLAFTQGFGRGARDVVSLRVENGDTYLTCCGLVFKKS